MIKKAVLYILVIVLIVEIVGLLTQTVFLPVDILKTLPSFGDKGWIKPHNSLLSDPVFQFEPWRIFAKKQIVSGNIPLWNNLNGLGSPFLANLQTSIFFPLQALYYLLPVTWSIFLIALLKVFLYIYFFYLYLRQNKISKAISVIVSIASFEGFFAVWLSWPQTNVFLFFPLILTFIDRYATQKKKKYIILLPIVFFVAFLGGHPETFFLISLVTSIYSFVRFRKVFVKVIISIIYSLFLSSCLLFPFLEYLFNSYALISRLTQVTHQLPLYSLAFDIFPYLLGAPNLSFYKPLSTFANYQELVGGYAGLIAILVAVIVIVRFWKQEFVRVWFVIGAVSIFIAYQFPVVSLLVQNSVIKANANHRMSAFIGTAILMLFAFGLNRLIKDKKALISIRMAKGYFLFAAVLVCCYIISFFVPLGWGGKYHDFYSFLFRHILFVLFSTIFFFLVISQRNKVSKSVLILGISALFFSQTILFFVSYNTFSPEHFYYPTNEIIKYLQLHPGNVIQVGNPSLPPNINLAYQISNVQNDDAMQIATFRRAFDKAFPKKNLWGNIDEVTKTNLENFNITNVISDYDIRNEKISVSKGTKDVYPLFNNKYSVEFTGNGEELRQIRLLTATYNRVNNCVVEASLLKVSNEENIKSVTFPCKKVYDKMFYTADIGPVNLESGEKYKLSISEHNDGTTNSIGIVGEHKIPYLDLLFKDNEFNGIGEYKKINNLYITTFKDRRLIVGKGISVKVINNSPTNLSFTVNSKLTTQLKIYKTSYPGWDAYINNKKVEIESLSPFMGINVSKGENFVNISYHPVSFLIGLAVSFISFLLLIIYMIRTLYLDKKSILYKNVLKLIEYLRHNLIYISLDYVIVTAVISMLVGVFCYLLVLKIFPFNFVYNDNMVINWFYKFKYPKQQDYFFYFFGFAFINVIGLFVWMILLSKRKEKK